MIPKEFLQGKPSESELIIRLITGAEIHVLGMDKPERVEGSPWDGGILDEYGNMKPQVWPNHVRPALSDRLGWCDLIGVPEGRNHYYDIWKLALAELAELGDKSQYGAYHWLSADILPVSEIVQAKRDLDELTYDQEYEANFVNFQGRAYYPFDEKTHCARLIDRYRSPHPLIIVFDFNVDPGVAAIGQEMLLPSGDEGTGWIGEVHIPRNSNTPAVCDKIIEDWGDHQGRVLCYGDASGGARGTAQIDGSDWDLIKSKFKKAFPDRVEYRVPDSNPSERSRINAMNTRLKTGDGRIRMMVDPSKAPFLVKDFEGVSLLIGGSGQIDKNKDKSISHLTDAVGYYVDHEYPINKEDSDTEDILRSSLVA